MPTITTKPTAKELDLFWKKEILSWIDLEGYDLPKPKTLKEKLATLEEVIKKEMRVDYIYQKELSNYLQGLPSIISPVFYNWEILQLMEKIGTINEKTPEKRKEALLENYWDFVASKLLQMINGTRIPKELRY